MTQETREGYNMVAMDLEMRLIIPKLLEIISYHCQQAQKRKSKH